MADTVEGLVKLLRSRIGSEFDDEAHLSGDEAEQIIAALEALVVERDALAEALRQILRCEYDGAGLFDCVDNDGERYQSADLCKRIEEAEALLSARSTLNELAVK